MVLVCLLHLLQNILHILFPPNNFCASFKLVHCQSWHLIIKNFSLRFDFLCAISINLLKIAQKFAPVRIIAVMFTFSFSSAFAAVDWTGETASKYLTEQGDYEINTAVTGEPAVNGESKRGTEGITEAYRAQLTAAAKAELKYVKGKDTPFYAPEKAEAVALIEAYIESLKTVKTAKDAKALKDKLEKEVGVFTTAPNALNTTTSTLKDKATVRTAAAGTDGIAKARKDANTGADGDATVDITRIVARAAGADLYLPGYVTLDNDGDGGNDNVVTAGSPAKSELVLTGGAAAKASEIFVPSPTADTVHAKVVDWFMDNDYRTKGDFAAGARAFAAALKAKDAAYTKTVTDERDAIQTEIYKYVDKDAALRPGRSLPLSDLEGIDALVKKINAFNYNYAGFGLALDVTDFIKVITGAGKLADSYFDQYYSEVSAIPEVKKLTDADKATVVALYKKVVALEDSYDDVWTYAQKGSARDNAYDFAKLENAYKHFLKKDVKAYGELAKFDEMTKGTAGKYYFDASEKNVNALKAKRAAFDALVKDYGYADLSKNGMSYVDAAKAEALILAAEHNMTADADYDVKDNTKLQTYLNNATLKVTTKALGNTKIRVNAQIDAESFKLIVPEMEEGSTISYQFYYKTAAAKTYKASTVKDRNYITYTKKSLKKGTKYKFQCSVIIKDANGNVVATKDYKASTIGSRVCR